MAHTLQERYSSLVLAKLRKELVLKDVIVFNNDYEGNPVAGAVKIPLNLPIRNKKGLLKFFHKPSGNKNC